MNKLLLTLGVALASCNPSPENSNATKTEEADGVVQETKVQAITSEKAKALVLANKDIVILDVRTPKEYGSGHLKNAQHIDFYLPDFSNRLQALNPNKTYLVYCAVGGRSRKAAQMMAEMGFRKVYNASEGFPALKESGIPAE